MLTSDETYLIAAYEDAQKSGDRSTQNGAVLVNPHNGQIVARGWNDIHPPLRDTEERRTKRPEKYQWVEHAERAAIYDAARRGVPTVGLWLFCPWNACADCGRAIVHAGISRVVGHKIPQHGTRPDWEASIAVARTMFEEAGIEVVNVEAKLGVRFRFDGREIEV